MIGRVISRKMEKTATVLVEGTKTHHLYKKVFRQSKKYLVDDSLHTQPGDMVEIKEIKPISKRKKWQIIKVLGKSMKEIVKEQLKAESQRKVAEVMPEKEEEGGSTQNNLKSGR